MDSSNESIALFHRMRTVGTGPAVLLLLACCHIRHQTEAEEPQTGDPAQELAGKMHAALKKANPGYKGGGKFTVKGGKLVSISLMRCREVADLSPLKEFPLESVTSLILYAAAKVRDLSPIAACRLTQLNTERCVAIADLSPLSGMPLKYFRMYACKGVTDLTPLKGMPLRHLDIGLNPGISDLSALEGMKLTDLRIDNCPKITDISVVKGMPLKFLSIFGSPGIKDFSPLEGLPLETLYFAPALLTEEELRIVREMKSLKKIGTSWADYSKKQNPEEFWKRYDAGEFVPAKPPPKPKSEQGP